MSNIAVVLAGGIGRRMGGTVPKQFLKIDGRSVIERSVDAFDRHPDIDEVAVVVHPLWCNEMQRLVTTNGWRKVSRIIDGGAERFDSSRNAVEAFADRPDSCNLLLHDAARPFVSARIISDVVDALRTHEAAAVAIPCTDTVWVVEQGRVSHVPPRADMWMAQTPQAFRLGLLRRAYAMGTVHATDDCGLVLHNVPQADIAVVEGDRENRKITFPSDLEK